MSSIRVCDDALVLLSSRLAESVSALTHLEAELEADSVESGEIVQEIGRLGKIEDDLDDLIRDASLAVERPVWADPIRLQMIRQTVAQMVGPAEAVIPGGSGDLELVLRLIDTFSGVDTAES